MDATQAIVTPNGKPTRQLIAQINRLRTLATAPSLGALTTVVDKEGKPTRPLINIMFALTGKAPNANIAIVDPKNGYPTKPFLHLVNA